MGYQVILERNPATGIWVAQAVGIPGAYTQGKDRAEALANIREAIALVRETDGLPPPSHAELVDIEA